MSTVGIDRIHGMTIRTYNRVPIVVDGIVEFGGKQYDGFYVSYNDYDLDTYGSDTTALVLGQMQEFFILNGNHVPNYQQLDGETFNKYLEYFYSQSAHINEFTTVKLSAVEEYLESCERISRQNRCNRV